MSLSAWIQEQMQFREKVFLTKSRVRVRETERDGNKLVVANDFKINKFMVYLIYCPQSLRRISVCCRFQWEMMTPVISKQLELLNLRSCLLVFIITDTIILMYWLTIIIGNNFICTTNSTIGTILIDNNNIFIQLLFSHKQCALIEYIALLK